MKLAIFLIFTCTSSGMFFYQLLKTEQKEKKQKEAVLQVSVLEDTVVTLVAVGDMMLGTNFPDNSLLPPAGELLLKPLWSVLQRGDLTFGNLEGTLLNQGGELKNCSDWSKCYAFRQPEYFADQLKEAGFDLLSVANNHMGDFGETGRNNTVKVLREKGFRFAGLEICPWDTITVKGIKIGFAGFAPNSGCLQINDYEVAKELVGKLNDLCDIVVVSFHGGAEGSSKTHITRKSEIFYDENRGNVYEFARVVIDAGADVVLGHGPHVTRAIDSYKGRFISYSMGNFCTYRKFNLSGVNGIAPVFELKVTKSGIFMEGNIVSIKQLGEGGPTIDESGAALEQIKSLTMTDLPELKVSFGATGSFKFN
jgi:poly-gamma-glutamate capsule biosynthesis protein CapA/YwtB (metallophosphatase superfamily)